MFWNWSNKNALIFILVRKYCYFERRGVKSKKFPIFLDNLLKLNRYLKKLYYLRLVFDLFQIFYYSKTKNSRYLKLL